MKENKDFYNPSKPQSFKKNSLRINSNENVVKQSKHTR